MAYPSDYKKQREEMVKNQIQARGISDTATINAMLHVPRHFFVPDNIIHLCYMDAPLSIGDGQTISQPYIVALMNQLAEIDQNSVVLDIGTGSGYAAAVSAYTAKAVYTIERIPKLFKQAQARFEKLNINNIDCKCGDGSLGWQEHAPFDAIIVAAATDQIPKALLNQLKIDGNLIIPIGDVYSQELIKIKKIADDQFITDAVLPVRFVPLIGDKYE